MTQTTSETTTTVFYFEPPQAEQVAREREIYRRVFDEFKEWTGTLDDLMQKYGMTARDLVYKSDLSALILDVAEGKKTRDEAKDWIKGFVALAYNRSKILEEEPKKEA